MNILSKKIKNFTAITKDYSFDNAIAHNDILNPQDIKIFLRDEYTYGLTKSSIHCWFMLWITISGNGNLLIEDHYMRLKKNDAIFIFPNQPHLRLPQGQEKVEYLVIRFGLPKIPSWLKKFQLKKIETTDKINNIIIDLCESYQIARYKRGALEQTNCITKLSNLITEIAFSSKETSENVQFTNANIDERINQTCKLLLSQDKTENSLNAIAEKLGISEGHLRREFKKELNITPKEFLTEYYTNLATHLLLYSNNNIKQIANKCGFQSSFSFSRFYRNNTGKSPTSVRKTANSKNIQ